MRNHNDSELGVVPVRAADPVWPWFLAGFCSFALIALMFTGALYFAGLSHAANPSHPVIVEHAP